MTIYTIGHSTHAADAFLALLATHPIGQVADVRTIPHSRRHPHFGREVMPDWLGQGGVGYRHFPGLGGLRRPRPDSMNTAVRHPAFRGYADHMQTAEFRNAVDALLIFAQEVPTAVMCAESVWWRCHRRFVADALFVGGVTVLHIMGPASPKPHELSDFGRPHDGTVAYPGLV